MILQQLIFHKLAFKRKKGYKCLSNKKIAIQYLNKLHGWLWKGKNMTIVMRNKKLQFQSVSIN